MVDSRTSEAPDTEELGRYRLVATLGQGGMGTIHLAVAGGLGAFRKLLVLKELRRDLTRNERFVQMFLAEAKLAARLNHPNVVQTLEAGREEERYFLAMEFLDGQPLSQILKSAERSPRFSLAARIQVLCHALAGLHYAHELCDYDGTALQIVHRDVSPQNVFVTYDGQVKVVDFGIAKAAGEDSLTSPGIFKGKLAYASPEQVRGQPVDRRSDVFSVGVMLWEAVTMRRLAPGSPTRTMIEARIAGTEPKLSDVVPDVEPVLAEICNRATHVDPAMRYATAEEFRAALQTFLFVSGENVDGAALGKAVRTKFADERAAMHRLIDVYIRESGKDEPTESMVRALRMTQDDQSGHDDPTTVADLSQLIESSKSDPPPTLPPPAAWAPPAPPVAKGRSIRWALAGAAVLAVAVLATRGLSSPPDAPKVAATPEAPAPKTPETAETAPPATARAEATAPSVEAARPVREVGRALVKAQQEPPEAPPRREPVEPVVSSPKPAHGAAPAAESPAAAPAETAKEAPAQHENMGDDLRQLKKRSPRTLDTQDPFQ